MARDNKGQFTEGNPGRPKGIKNRTPKQTKTMLMNFLHDNFEEVQQDFHKLEPKDQFEILVNMARNLLTE